ncbi:hypothetical protein M2277_005116 [Paenibacillus sp. LBL]|uniref:hypothetical protein n=1 Tax=Paenibacillus sp. LBL TaxID=2940563 RepID=UPI0024762C9D|nr:hypothetical protein [Paenibacillus sp. LBL]MDH6674424.1 hypothetical protein [Paenibacillus sp. LBL]
MSNDFEQRINAMTFASLGKMIVTDLKKGRESTILKKYKKEQVVSFLESPDKNQKQLREISNIIYNKSPHYQRLINYFANMPVFRYIVEPVGLEVNKVNKKTFINQYKRVNEMLELMNIRHEFGKILNTAFKEDVFYGYEHSTKDSYFIQRLNPDYCRISSIEDGVYNFAWDFSYFNTYPDKLKNFPKEFEVKYNQYKNNKDAQWIELNPENTICIKINSDIEYPVLPFAGLFDAIFEIEEFKALRKTKEEMGNYKILVQELPMRKDSLQNNDFLIDFTHMSLFHNRASEALPENVGLVTSPMKITDISFDKDRVDADNVAKAERDFWGASGVSQLLFNADKAGSIGLDKSIKTDEMLVFNILRQFERWLNRKSRFFNNNTLFKVSLLDLTIFNIDEVFERALKAATFGIPSKTIIGAVLGMSPTALTNMAYLENEILQMHVNFIPVSSAHTGMNDQGGRPSQGDNVSEEGLKARDQGKNISK